MKNIKLTLATTLSILTMTFSGSVLANDWNSGNNYKYNQYNTNKIVAKKIAKKNNRTLIAKKTVYPVSTKIVNNRINNTNQYNKAIEKKKIIQRQNTKVSNLYSIRSGDTLYSISLRTGVSVNKLARLNNLNTKKVHSLRIGQILRLVWI